MELIIEKVFTYIYWPGTDPVQHAGKTWEQIHFYWPLLSMSHVLVMQAWSSANYNIASEVFRIK